MTKRIDFIINKLSEKNIYTNILGLGRTVLALNTLLTLLFNSPDTLFKPGGSIGNTASSLFLLKKINFFFLLPYQYINILIWISICLLLLVASGWKPRVTCIFHCWICISFINSAVLIEGGDQIVSNISFLLLPICLLDSRKWHWESKNHTERFIKEKNLIANFFYILIRLQVCIIYFHSAIGKMFVTEWRNGTALYYWFNDPVFGVIDVLKPIINSILYNAFLIVMLTWGVILFEIILFMGFVMEKRYWKYLLAGGLLFHFSIIVIHGLFSFFIAMAGALILYLGPISKNIFLKKTKSSALYFSSLEIA